MAELFKPKAHAIEVVDPDTGDERTLTIKAKNRQQAERSAMSRGYRLKVTPVEQEMQQRVPTRRGARGIYEVEVLDRSDGSSRWVRVESFGMEQARSKVAEMGEIVGAVRVVELLAASQPGTAVIRDCPECGTCGQWTGGRPAAHWLAMVLFFPIGLLLLLLTPTWRCRACGYAYDSYRPPQGFGRERTQDNGVWIAIIIALAVLIGGVVVVAVWGEPKETPTERHNRIMRPVIEMQRETQRMKLELEQGIMLDRMRQNIHRPEYSDFDLGSEPMHPDALNEELKRRYRQAPPDPRN